MTRGYSCSIQVVSVFLTWRNGTDITGQKPQMRGSCWSSQTKRIAPGNALLRTGCRGYLPMSTIGWRCLCTAWVQRSSHERQPFWFCSASGSPSSVSSLDSKNVTYNIYRSLSNFLWLHHHITGSHRCRKKEMGDWTWQEKRGQKAQTMRMGSGREHVPAAALVLCKNIFVKRPMVGGRFPMAL